MRSRHGRARLMPLMVAGALIVMAVVARQWREAIPERRAPLAVGARARTVRPAEGRSDVVLPRIDIPAGRRVVFSIPPGWEVASRAPASN